MKTAFPGRQHAAASPELELAAPNGEIVHLWVQRKSAENCMPALDRLLRGLRMPDNRNTRGYRFLGASRVRKAGVECLRMSFCLQR